MYTRKLSQALGILAAFCSSTALALAANELVYPTGVFGQAVTYQAPAPSETMAAAEEPAKPVPVPSISAVADKSVPPAAYTKTASPAEEPLTDRYIALGIATALLAFAFFKKSPKLSTPALNEAESRKPVPVVENSAADALPESLPVAVETAQVPMVFEEAVAVNNIITPPAVRGNVVVPVDFSSNSEFAIRLALIWAKPNDRLRVVYAVDLDNAFPSANLTPSDFIAVHPAFADIGGETAYHWSQLPWVVVLPQALEIVERWAVNEFVKLMQALPAASHENLEFRVLHGDPVEQIVRYSDDMAASLIVLLAHKHTSVERLISGSHADQLLHASRIPVIVACEPLQADLSLPLDILITTDHSPESLPVFLVLLDLIQGRKPNITVLTVDKPHAPPAKTPAKLEGLEQALRSLGLQLINVKLEASDVETAILDYLKTHKPQLIAMSSHGRMGFAELIHPSVTKAILHEAGIPILVVHGRGMPTTSTIGSLTDILGLVTG